MEDIIGKKAYKKSGFYSGIEEFKKEMEELNIFMFDESVASDIIMEAFKEFTREIKEEYQEKLRAKSNEYFKLLESKLFED